MPDNSSGIGTKVTKMELANGMEEIWSDSVVGKFIPRFLRQETSSMRSIAKAISIGIVTKVSRMARRSGMDQYWRPAVVGTKSQPLRQAIIFSTQLIAPGE